LSSTKCFQSFQKSRRDGDVEAIVGGARELIPSSTERCSILQTIRGRTPLSWNDRDYMMVAALPLEAYLSEIA
jgi:hypothetical protein